MTVTLDRADTESYLRITAKGRIGSLEELSEYASRVISEATRYGKRCLLLDERGLRTDLELVDIIEFVEELSAQGIQSMRLRIAVLGSRTRRPDLSQDFEVFLQSKNFRYKIFETAEPALHWLGQPDCNLDGVPD